VSEVCRLFTETAARKASQPHGELEDSSTDGPRLRILYLIFVMVNRLNQLGRSCSVQLTQMFQTPGRKRSSNFVERIYGRENVHLTSF